MTLIEAAYTVLSKNKAISLSAREITDQAIKEGLINPKSKKPWVHLHSAIRERNKQMRSAGINEQFSFVKGKWKLS